ncbi:cytochrome P450 [Streptomyces sp. NPDC049577]|uniref:cytochrome P450 n=1 Tax=Streptomyces sp. NPDC049577 TaxID=3155153 RepID=UPI00343F5134
MSEQTGATAEPRADGQGCPLLSSASIATTFLSHGSSQLYPVLKNLRDNAPVSFVRELGLWIVTRYEDVSTVLKDARRFPASTRSVIMQGCRPEVRDVLRRTATFTAPNMGFDGPPDHDRLRSPVAQFFSARGARRLEPRVRATARRCIARLPAEPPVDLVEEYARPLANKVVIDLAGLPAEDYDLIVRHHRAVNDFFFGRPPEHLRLALAHDVLAWEEYLAGIIARRRSEPGDDLISMLVRKTAEGEADYSEAELISLISFDMITAGFRPTSFALVNLFRELLEEPERWQRLREEPATFDAVFNEILRHSGPALGVFRVTAVPVELGGVPVPAGAPLWLVTASANRDERRFPEPDVHDPGRAHLTSSLHFSQGLHRCLGANLARTVAREAVTALMRHRPGLRLIQGQTWQYEPSINVVAPTRLSATW